MNDFRRFAIIIIQNREVIQKKIIQKRDKHIKTRFKHVRKEFLMNCDGIRFLSNSKSDF